MLIPKADGRIEQYLGFLERNAYVRRAELAFEMFEPPPGGGPDGAAADAPPPLRAPPGDEAAWRAIPSPAPWGREWACVWFRARYAAPRTDAPLFVSALPNADSLAFIDGEPAGAFNLYHKKLRIDGDGAEHTLHIEAYSGHRYPGCGPFEGESVVVTIGKTLPRFPNIFEGGALLERLPETYALYYDARALFETSRVLAPESLRKARIVKGLYDALMTVSLRLDAEKNGAELEAAARAARARLAPLLAARNGDTAPRVWLCGHAHIDHAWLWHTGETERKVARTYRNMLRFIREYPEFIFLQSQPCQLEIVKNEYPSIFEGVRAAFKSGNWDPNGAMWVEADCNIPSGESLIRQFLAGKAFTRECFGYEADTLWLPDVFGYSGALPQIMAGCRVRYFVTSKIGWNDTTRFPYDTFIWRGIDGTGIKTHFVSSKYAGYNGRVSPAELRGVWDDVQHKEIQGGFVRSIGEGDGGGGTLRQDLEMARRAGDLEGLPRTGWSTLSAALDALFSGADEAGLPEWKGELYLELHRGTYTSQARTKRRNRRLEFDLRFTEWLFAALAARDGAAYPHAALLSAWKQVLTLQFHDIIPGSSIGRVYAEAEAAYDRTAAALEALRAPAMNALREESGAPLLVFNALSWERRDPARLPAAALAAAGADGPDDAPCALRGAGGARYPLQRYRGPDGERAALCELPLPALGWAAFAVEPGADAADAAASPFSLEAGEDGGMRLFTPFYAVSFDRRGRICSFVDRERARELVREGGYFNMFVTAEDVPVFWSAWDIDADWEKSAADDSALLSSEVAAEGPLCFRLRQKRRVGQGSVLTQDIALYARSRRVDFDTEVRWQERQTLLKVSFDTAVFAPFIRCETQYGHTRRGVDRNLPQDRARFEICAHKWASLEDAAGGVALLNDGIYGCDAAGGRVRLTLLRSPVAPDAEADRGVHRFCYALLPFAGAFEDSGVIEAAYELNEPPRAAGGAASGHAAPPPPYSFCAVEPGDGAVIVECVKAAEDGTGLVVRLYETRGAARKARARFTAPLSRARLADMLEDALADIAFEGAAVPLEFRAFEIKTLRVEFGQSR